MLINTGTRCDLASGTQDIHISAVIGLIIVFFDPLKAISSAALFAEAILVSVKGSPLI